jgi:uncharacterized membrane protein
MSWALRFKLKEFRKNSLWLVPVAAVVILIVLQRVVRRLDAHWDAPSSLTFTPSTASAMLSAIMTASISLIGFMLTILVLVVQISGSSYSPRTLIFVFRNQQLKLSLGLFVGTMAFAFLSMGEISETKANDLSVVICAALMLFSVLFFLQSLSQLMHGIRPAKMADRIAAAGHRVVADVYPNPAPVEQDMHYRDGLPAQPPDRTVHNGGMGGVLQGLDIEGLVQLASAHNATIVLPLAAGDYLRYQGNAFEIYGGDSLPPDQELMGHIAVGSERTPEQDPIFALRVLVDISLKALSAAINDPTTGEQLLDRVEDLLVDLVRRDLDTGVVRDETNHLRLVFHTPTWEDYLRLGVTEIRLYGGANPQICRRMIALLDHLLEIAPDYRRGPILEERDRLRRNIEQNFPDPLDRAVASVPDTQGFGATDLPAYPRQHAGAAG